jgi:hypothetical protein
MRRHLQCIDEGLAAPLTRESTKVVCSDDHDFLAAVDGHMLRSFLFRAPHQLAEPGFGILQLPVPRSRAA